MGVLFRELTHHYRAFIGRRLPSLPRLRVQYRDFAEWQRLQHRGPAFDVQLSYWKRALDCCPEGTELTADRIRPPVRSSNGAVVSAAMPPALTAAVRALGRAEGASLYMTLLTAFAILLRRYTGQEDLVIGSPIACRDRVEIEPLIGFFVNTMPLRIDLSGDPSFRAALARVRETTLGAFANQDLPFEKIVEELRPERDRGRSPFCQVMFVLQNAPRSPLDLPGLSSEIVEIDPGTAKFDLTLIVTESDDGLMVAVEYSSDLFDRATIERLLDHYRTLVEAATAEPDRLISSLRLMGEREQQRMLVDWNATARDFPRDATIHDLFSAQALRRPRAVALAGGRTWTYEELDGYADRLAWRLRARGVGLGSVVALGLGRSPELVGAMLATLKAGGAYLPLDPDDPVARTSFLIQDAGATVVVTWARLVERFAGLGIRAIAIDEDFHVGDDVQPGPRSTADGPAYVMYTSGSTGRPKGVVVPHRAVVRLLFGVEYVALDHGPAVLHLAPPSFDASTFEVWAPLLHGGRCVLFPGRVPTAAELCEALRVHGVDTLWLAAGLFNAMIDEAPAVLSGVRQLLIGGEPLSIAHVRRAKRYLPGTRIINGYGPTESTTFACCHSIPDDLDGLTSIPVGRPIANTRVYVLDRWGKPVPVGVPGELYLGGDGLALGYVGRPGATAEAFLPDPFDDRPGGRLYRTGDRVRWLSDGTLEFLGRMDHQIKIRGFRVEPGEVEAILSRHPDVAQAAVVALDGGPLGRRLVAYIAPSAGREPASAELRDLLSTSLPPAWIPDQFVALSAMPLTPNGKVDRRALPEPAGRGKVDQRSQAPRDPLESELARIWEELLGSGPVALEDDFFRLGGHSLLAVRLLARVEAGFGVRLPLSSLFRAPTLGGLADLLRHGRGSSPEPPILSARPRDGTAPPLYFAPGGGPHGLLGLRPLADHLASRRELVAVDLAALADDSGPSLEIEAMAERLVGELSDAQPEGPIYLGGFSFGGLVAFEAARRLRLCGREVALLVLLDTFGPGYPRPINRLERERRHLAALRRLELASRPGYVVERLLNLARRLGLRRDSTLDADRPFEPFRRAAREYLAKRRTYGGKITLFRALIRPALHTCCYADSCNGWRESSPSVEVHDFACRHNDLMEEPWLGQIARAIEPHLGPAASG